MSLHLYASAALSRLPPLNGGSMLAVIAATESGSRVVLRLRHQVVMDHLAHHPPPPVEHPRAHNYRPRRVQLAAFSRIGSSAVPPWNMTTRSIASCAASTAVRGCSLWARRYRR